MSVVVEVTIDGGNRVERVAGCRVLIENGFLHIENDQGKTVAIFAKFDSVISQPGAQE